MKKICIVEVFRANVLKQTFSTLSMEFNNGGNNHKNSTCLPSRASKGSKNLFETAGVQDESVVNYCKIERFSIEYRKKFVFSFGLALLRSVIG